MRPLLSFTLQADSEDTIFHTAQAYFDNLPTWQLAQAQQRLAPLIRCQHLSGLWLTAAALSDDAPKLLLGDLQPQLKKLTLAKQTEPGFELTPGIIAEEVPDAPASWSLQPRVRQQLSDGVQLLWDIEVSAIKETVQRSASQHKRVDLYSPTASPPLGGIRWKMLLDADWKALTGLPGSSGVRIDLSAMPKGLPGDVFCKCSYQLGWNAGALSKSQPVDHIRVEGCTGPMCSDFFGVGVMSGGWDEAAWAAAGLPDGQLTLQLKVLALGHCK